MIYKDNGPRHFRFSTKAIETACGEALFEDMEHARASTKEKYGDIERHYRNRPAKVSVTSWLNIVNCPDCLKASLTFLFNKYLDFFAKNA